MDLRIDLGDGDIVGAVLGLGNGEFRVAVAVLAIFCLTSFFSALRYFARARTIENVPTSKIRSAAQGYVELEGHAMPAASRGAQTSPLGHRQCLWWDYKVQQRSGNSHGPAASLLREDCSVGIAIPSA